MTKILLAGVAALSVLSASAAHAHATVKLPDTITGFWCVLEWGNDQNHNRHIFARTPDGCHVPDGGIKIDQEGNRWRRGWQVHI